MAPRRKCKEHNADNETVPKAVNSIKHNDWVILKDKICKIIEISRAEPGKHGHAKILFVGRDVKSGKKVEDSIASKSRIQTPVLKKQDMLVVDIMTDEPFINLLNETCDVISVQCDDKIHGQMKRAHANLAPSEDMYACVIEAMGRKWVASFRAVRDPSQGG